MNIKMKVLSATYIKQYLRITYIDSIISSFEFSTNCPCTVKRSICINWDKRKTLSLMSTPEISDCDATCFEA